MWDNCTFFVLFNPFFIFFCFKFQSDIFLFWRLPFLIFSFSFILRVSFDGKPGRFKSLTLIRDFRLRLQMASGFQYKIQTFTTSPSEFEGSTMGNFTKVECLLGLFVVLSNIERLVRLVTRKTPLPPFVKFFLFTSGTQATLTYRVSLRWTYHILDLVLYDLNINLLSHDNCVLLLNFLCVYS